MHRILRSERSLLRLQNKGLAKTTHPYICLTCKPCATSFSSLTRRAADAGVPFSEKVRRKIWGADLPPEQAYSYAQKDHLELAQPVNNKPKNLKQKKHNLTAASEGFDQYDPAITWDGLQQIGGPEEMLVQEWLPGNKFRDSFIPRDVMTDTHEIIANLRRAFVEIFLWQQAGYHLADIYMTQKPSIDLTRNVQIAFSNAKGVTLEYPDNDIREKVINSLKRPKLEENSIPEIEMSEKDGLEDESGSATPNETVNADDSMKSLGSQDSDAKDSTLDEPQPEVEAEIDENNTLDLLSEPVNYQELVASWNPSWMGIPVTDPTIKFAVIKRITNLSGIRVPDIAITSMTTARTLLDQIVKPPKSQKLAEILIQKGELTNLPNVSIHPRPITLRDKETAVGRWKLIEEEFISRGILPEKEI